MKYKRFTLVHCIGFFFVGLVLATVAITAIKYVSAQSPKQDSEPVTIQDSSDETKSDRVEYRYYSNKPMKVLQVPPDSEVGNWKLAIVDVDTQRLVRKEMIPDYIANARIEKKDGKVTYAGVMAYGKEGGSMAYVDYGAFGQKDGGQQVSVSDRFTIYFDAERVLIGRVEDGEIVEYNYTLEKKPEDE